MLEELARVSRRQDHADAKLYEELARQAKVKQGQLDLAHFCLTMPSGKAGNVKTKALSKRNRKNWAGKSIIQSNLNYSKCQGPQESFRIIGSSNDRKREFSDIFGKDQILS